MFKKFARFFFLLTLAVSTRAMAEEPISIVNVNVVPDNIVYGAFGGHIEQRSGNSKTNIDAYAGYDRYLGNGYYVGARLGILQEQVLSFLATTQTKFFGGAQGYKIFALSNVVDLKAGVNVDLAQGDSTDPIYLYTGVNVGPRIYFNRQIHVDVPLEVGLWPFFSGIPVFFKAAVQVGFGF